MAHIELYGGKGYEYMKKSCVADGRVRRYLPGNSIWKISEHDFSSIVGIAVVALPAGVITGDILRRLRRAGKIRFHIIACIIQVC